MTSTESGGQHLLQPSVPKVCFCHAHVCSGSSWELARPHRCCCAGLLWEPEEGGWSLQRLTWKAECRADPRPGRVSSHQAKVLGPAPAQNTPALGPQVPPCASVRTSQWPGTRSISTSPSWLYREGNGRRSYSLENLKGWGDLSHRFHPTREGDKKTFVKTCVSC